jgi:hypothetical protein
VGIRRERSVDLGLWGEVGLVKERGWGNCERKGVDAEKGSVRAVGAFNKGGESMGSGKKIQAY